MVAHEYAHGYAALRQGDNTALMLGRLTLNPVKHIDPWLSIVFPLMLWFGTAGRFVFGGAKPVPVNPRNYRNYRRGDIIVSSAGVVVNMGLFVACTVLAVATGIVGQSLPLTAPVMGLLQRMMVWGVWLNLLLANFNLIPIPPLDGSHILYHMLPRHIGARFRELSRYGFLILLALLIFVQSLFVLLLLPAILLFRLAASLISPFALQPLLFS
jgi:Zn-dependent protease